jgi:hypothetical protein
MSRFRETESLVTITKDKLKDKTWAKLSTRVWVQTIQYMYVIQNA